MLVLVLVVTAAAAAALLRFDLQQDLLGCTTTVALSPTTNTNTNITTTNTATTNTITTEVRVVGAAPAATLLLTTTAWIGPRTGSSGSGDRAAVQASGRARSLGSCAGVS